MDKLVDALYSRFLLRDLFGKIVPGWLALRALMPVTERMLPGGDYVVSGVAAVALGAGVAWLIAFALQSLGERFRILRYHPARYSEHEARYALRVRFDREATEREKQQVERLVVIKEATGIGALSMYLGAISELVRALGSVGGPGLAGLHLLALVLFLLFGWLLRRSHHAHAEREYNYMDVVLGGSSPAELRGIQ